MLCDCSVTVVGGERLPSSSINNDVVSPAFSYLLLFSIACFSSLPFASTMGKNNKRKREPTPPSEDFGDSEYSEEEFSSESEGSLAPIPLREGLTAEVWTYIRAVERSGLAGSDESEYSSDEEDSSEEGDGGDGDGDGDDDDEGGGGDDGDGGSRGSSGGGKGDDGGSSRGGSGGGGSSKGSNKASG
jgi:hypothetical protein